jgi:hypothetical protein
MSGSRSAQADVVVLNEDQPFGLAGRASATEPGVFIVEGVSAIGEIKSVLTKGELEDAIKKGWKAKQLRVSETSHAATHTVGSDILRFGPCPPFFIFAFESQLAETTYMQLLHTVPSISVPAVMGDEATVNIPAIDAVFILDGLSVVNVFRYDGEIRAMDRSSPWAAMRQAPTLVAFLLWLHSSMPRKRRFVSPAAQYLRVLMRPQDEGEP